MPTIMVQNKMNKYLPDILKISRPKNSKITPATKNKETEENLKDKITRQTESKAAATIGYLFIYLAIISIPLPKIKPRKNSGFIYFSIEF